MHACRTFIFAQRNLSAIVDLAYLYVLVKRVQEPERVRNHSAEQYCSIALC